MYQRQRVNSTADWPLMLFGELFTDQREEERERGFKTALKPSRAALVNSSAGNLIERISNKALDFIMSPSANFGAVNHLKQVKKQVTIYDLHFCRTKPRRQKHSFISVSVCAHFYVKLPLIFSQQHLCTHLCPDSDQGSVVQHHLADTCCCPFLNNKEKTNFPQGFTKLHVDKSAAYFIAHKN